VTRNCHTTEGLSIKWNLLAPNVRQKPVIESLSRGRELSPVDLFLGGRAEMALPVFQFEDMRMRHVAMIDVQKGMWGTSVGREIGDWR
jgi:hypothetical protein